MEPLRDVVLLFGSQRGHGDSPTFELNLGPLHRLSLRVTRIAGLGGVQRMAETGMG